MHGAVWSVAAVLWAEGAAEVARVFVEEIDDLCECDLVGVLAETVATVGPGGAGDEVGG